MKCRISKFAIFAILLLLLSCGGGGGGSGGDSGGSGGGDSGGDTGGGSGEDGAPTGELDENFSTALPFALSDLLTDLSTISTFFPYGPPRSSGYDDGYPAISWAGAVEFIVLASADGTITSIESTDGGNSYNLIQSITDYDGWRFNYVNLIDVVVSENDVVSKGDTIAKVQSGGFNYYPLWWNLSFSGSNSGTCPIAYLDDGSKAAAKSYLEAWNDYIDANPETSDPFRCYCYTYGLSQDEALAVSESECDPAL